MVVEEESEISMVVEGESEITMVVGETPIGYGVFNGTTAYVDCGDSDLFSFGNDIEDFPFSVSVWVYAESVDRNNILYKSQEYRIQIGGTGGIYVKLYSRVVGGGYISYGGVDVPQNEWVHFCVTYDGRGGIQGANGINGYINGSISPPSSTARGSQGGYISMGNKDNPMLIGGEDLSEPRDFKFNGRMRNFKIYDIELTAEQVSAEYENSGGSDAYLIADYRLHFSVEDYGPNGLDGINYNVIFPEMPKLSLSSEIKSAITINIEETSEITIEINKDSELNNG